jgi:hypothetical protein
MGAAIIHGIASGITGAVGGLVSAATSAAQQAFQAAKDALGIKSPSELAAREVGEPFTQGVALGITRSAGLIVQAIGKAVNPMGSRLPLAVGISASGLSAGGVTGAGGAVGGVGSDAQAKVLAQMLQELTTMRRAITGTPRVNSFAASLRSA